MKVPFGCARSSVLDEQLPGSLVETRHVLLEHRFVSLHSRKGKVLELPELVSIDIHLFLDILPRNGAVAEACLAQDAPAEFPKARELALSQR
mgnify:CR=1 FL=1